MTETKGFIVIFEDLQNLPKRKKRVAKREFRQNSYRSHLMVRGDNIKHLNKLDELKCDVATINLEDGIYDKKEALRLTEIFLSHLKNSYAKVAIRVNELNCGGFEEIEKLSYLKPYAFRIPKIKNQKELKELLKVVPQGIKLALTIETKEAFYSLKKFKHKRVTMLYLGILDLLSDLHLPQSMVSFDNETIRYLMSRFVVDCKMIDALPISFTYQEYKNEDAYRRWCEISKRLGFVGQSAISPNQVEIANSIFVKSENELERAREIKRLFEERREGGGFVHKEYGFIDEPIYRDALVVLESKD